MGLIGDLLAAYGAICVGQLRPRLSAILKRTQPAVPVTLAQHIVYLMETDCAGWEPDRHYASHKKTGLRLWTANGESHVRAAPSGEPEIKFTWLERKRIWTAWKTCLRVKVASKTEEILAQIRSAT